ncbi:MAG: hypothetical protein COB75_07505 [Idiomarina sp.]|nr:hypothetical protein [Idiomarina sp.]PHQ74466.1 MAG: hypothetical protein COB75_07505 [Idiomarina sp.]
MNNQPLNYTGLLEENLRCLPAIHAKSSRKRIILVSLPEQCIANLVYCGQSLQSAMDSWLSHIEKAKKLYSNAATDYELKVVQHPESDFNNAELYKEIGELAALKNAEIEKLRKWMLECAVIDFEHDFLLNATKKLEQDNNELLGQLHSLQEEFEHYFVNDRKRAVSPTVNTRKKKKYSFKSMGVVSRFLLLPLRHFLVAVREHFRFRREAKIIRKSKLFDKQWYSNTYTDIKSFKGDEALHYAAHGADEGRDPGPNFSSERYWRLNPDVAGSKTNPLVHWECYGKDEGRLYK